MSTSVNIVWLRLLSKLKFVDPTCLCSVVKNQHLITMSEANFTNSIIEGKKKTLTGMRFMTSKQCTVTSYLNSSNNINQ